MKVFYIVGLEHSGTTLTDHLLSSHPGILGLGEISSFLSPSHMKQYMNKWGGCSDVSLCSCGEDWNHCEFWGGVVKLWGLNSEDSMVNKYKKLFSYIREVRGDDAVVVDSSKSLTTLKMLIKNSEILGVSPTDIFVIFTIKDVRSFSASIVNKHDNKESFISVIQSFNYWLGENRKILDYIESSDIKLSVNLYEDLCTDPGGFLNKELDRAGCKEQVGEVDIKKNSSHIAMGNKNFIMRNRNKIKYDSRWFHDDLINLVYLIHGKARRFNKHIHALLQAEGAHQEEG